MLKFLKKNFSIIFFTIFILIFSYFFWWDYKEFYEKQESKLLEQVELKQSLETFSLDKIRELEYSKIYYTPYKWLLDKIVNKIRKSKKRVYVEVYMLTETRIKNALIKANKRWIDVKVILEKNPYMAAWINNKHFDFLKKSWVNVVWSNTSNFSLNHAKFFIIDDFIIDSTGNFTYSTFAFNRDFFIFIEDKILLWKFLSIFKNDFSWNKKMIYETNLVLSPNYSRMKFEKLFENAKNEINMYFQYFSDKKLEKLLIKKAKSWVIINAVVSKEFYKNKQEKVKYLEKNWINIKYLEKYKMHSKAILIDKKYLFLWSINFSNYSLDANREVWILLINKKNIENFLKIFNKDFY